MAKANPVPSDHHVARYVPKKLQVRDENDLLLGVFPDAFALNENKGGQPERWLSTTWMEFFSHAVNRPEMAACVAEAMRATGFSLTKSGALAVLCVGPMINAAANRHKLKLRVLHEPSRSRGNPGYAPVHGYTHTCGADTLKDIFILTASVDLFEVRSLPSAPTLPT
jgi:hypothetical protein